MLPGKSSQAMTARTVLASLILDAIFQRKLPRRRWRCNINM
jgi:hypothetical protein